MLHRRRVAEVLQALLPLADALGTRHEGGREPFLTVCELDRDVRPGRQIGEYPLIDRRPG